MATKAVLEGRMAPPKLARKGDFQPQFVCATFRHSQWLRQVRRLQSYCRHVRLHDPDTQHAKSVWGAIVRATGFSPSFPEWWAHSSIRTYGAPACLPLIPPPFDICQLIYETMCLALRQFELELSKSSRLYARLRRENNPNAIFQDLKAFPDKGVHVLMQPKCAKVVEVRLDDMALVLDHPVDFDPDQPVVCNTNPIPVIHADHDCVWVQSVDGLEPGCTISQLSKIGTDDDLFHTFLHTWKQMWERHSQVPPDRWETILAFARHHLPRQQFSWPPTEETSLSQCVSHKKHTTAGGLDGVSLRDLQAMPYNALSNFVSI